MTIDIAMTPLNMVMIGVIAFAVIAIVVGAIIDFLTRD